jgi:23S rRNA (adenine2503-C2)-methyltransferase
MQTQPTRQSILDFSHGELCRWMEAHGQTRYRAGQILRWIYHRQANSFGEMTDVGKALRALLSEHFTIPRQAVEKETASADGTVKFLARLADGEAAESVLIPERGHLTLCVSTQVGCAMGCAFCRTGSGGLVRNLTPGEILAQVRDARLKATEEAPLTNLVFMGMGEPLANYDNLVRALAVITSADHGLAFAGRRVTVSTSGLVPQIAELGQDTQASLAVSLNATTDEVRDAVMPVNRKWNIQALLHACRAFPLKSGRRITFEYVLLKGVNDSEADARRLARLLAGMPAKVNLIAYNPHPESRFERPDPETVLRFQAVLMEKHFTAVVRKSKGDDILAACGQLRADRA